MRRKRVSNGRNCILKSQEEKKGLSNLIDKLYDDQGHFRDDNNRLTTQIAVYKVLKCRDLKCTNRNPPIENNINSEDKEDKDCERRLPRSKRIGELDVKRLCHACHRLCRGTRLTKRHKYSNKIK